MEAARLNGPPDWLERIVLHTIPPAARESVAGDLWETYRGPRQYAAEALKTVPFVVASQMRRNLNLPALMLQGALIFIFLGAPLTLILLCILLLRSAYQETMRPCPRQVFRETILLSSGVMALLFLLMSLTAPVVRAGVDHATWFGLFLNALFLSPLLCLIRAGLILRGDRAKSMTQGELLRDELGRAFSKFLKADRRHNLLQAAALGIAGLLGFFFSWNALVTGLFVLVSLYLLQNSAHDASCQLDFVSLRARYQRQLTRQQHLRHFLRWLWLTPVMVALHARLAAPAGQPITVFLDCVAVAILCFLLGALDREHGGRVQEQIGLLDRVREKISPA